MSNFKNIVTDANNLVEAFNQCKKGCSWKASVQEYEINLLKNINHIQHKIESFDYSQRPFNEFLLTDRGKTRLIKAVNIHDRVVLRCLCDQILVPTVSKYYIYDNGASVKGKGVSFTRKRLIKHLRSYYRKYGNQGYVLLIDFSKFFDNINHDKLLNSFQQILDEETMNFIKEAVYSFKIDVSYMSPQEYNQCYNNIFDSVWYKNNISNSLQDKKRFMYKSLGIGSQISQIAGLLYPTKIDNYCKIVKGLKYYGRYMDDIYIIHYNKKYLQNLLIKLNKIAREMGLFINPHKTQIIKLSKGFSFLQIKYSFGKNGKIIQKPNKKSIVRERRKLKKMKKMVDNNLIKMFDVQTSFQSWLGTIKHFDSYKTVKNMQRLYNSIFKN